MNNNNNIVNEWFKNNTFYCYDYKDLELLYENKKGKTISLVIPTLNEEKTVCNIIDKIFQELNHNYKIIDEVIVIDGGSTDTTVNIVKNLELKYKSLKLFNEKDILTNINNKKGKGNQLWKGLYVSKGDIILYCDSDIKNFDIRMIYGMIGPLLNNNIRFVKGFYERPLIINGVVNNNQGGRVTELCARPLINALYPELSGFLQPLGGEYGGYRDILESIDYMSGYGVEVKLMIDIYNTYGLNIMGQVDLLKREHKHQNTNSLTKMSYVIMDVILSNYNIKVSNQLYIKNVINDLDNTSNIKKYLQNIPNPCDEILESIKTIKNYRKKIINENF